MGKVQVSGPDSIVLIYRLNRPYYIYRMCLKGTIYYRIRLFKEHFAHVTLLMEKPITMTHPFAGLVGMTATGCLSTLVAIRHEA